jgi:hypothetical protein
MKRSSIIILVISIFSGAYLFAHPIQPMQMIDNSIRVVVFKNKQFLTSISLVSAKGKKFHYASVSKKGFLYEQCFPQKHEYKYGNKILILHNSYVLGCSQKGNTYLCDISFYDIISHNNEVTAAVNQHECVNIFPKQIKKKFHFTLSTGVHTIQLDNEYILKTKMKRIY